MENQLITTGYDLNNLILSFLIGIFFLLFWTYKKQMEKPLQIEKDRYNGAMTLFSIEIEKRKIAEDELKRLQNIPGLIGNPGPLLETRKIKFKRNVKKHESLKYLPNPNPRQEKYEHHPLWKWIGI